MSITNGIVSTKFNDQQDEFNHEKVNFPFLDVDVPYSSSYGVCISQLVRFARVCSHVDDFNNRNKVIDTINSLKVFLNFITNPQT